MIERRIAVSVRAEGTSDKPVLCGYAAVFNSLSKPIYTKSGNYFYERIAKGAFEKSIRQSRTVANLFHDMQKPLGTQKSGTLHLNEDSRGLYVRCEINPNVSYAMDAWHNAGATGGARLSSMSFAFKLADDESKNSRGDMWDELSDDDMDELDENWRASRRTILDVDELVDVAFLTEGTGAYDEANCYADMRIAFPEGTPASVEHRCIVKPSLKEVAKFDDAPTSEELRLQIQKLKLF
jgi:HK97 family phage prohead protease